MSTLYLAWSPSKAWETFKEWDWTNDPISILISYVYLQNYDSKANQHEFKPKNLMLDSGAFTAWKVGKEIDIDALIQEGLKTRYCETVCLDVISSAQESLKNALYMKAQGSKAYPVFHCGEPWEILDSYVKEFPKVGLGFKEKLDFNWISKCFERHWPHPFHSFGFISKKLLTTFPFHSADSTGWEAAHRHGSWSKSLGGIKVRDSWNLSLKPEILEYIRLEKYLKARWKKELSQWPEVI